MLSLIGVEWYELATEMTPSNSGTREWTETIWSYPQWWSRISASNGADLCRPIFDGLWSGRRLREVVRIRAVCCSVCMKLSP